MVGWLVCKQAKKCNIESTADRMGRPMDKVMVTIHKYDNTTNATIPICLWDYEQKFKPGNKLLLAAFAGGFTWATAYLLLGYDVAKAPQPNVKP